MKLRRLAATLSLAAALAACKSKSAADEAHLDRPAAATSPATEATRDKQAAGSAAAITEPPAPIDHRKVIRTGRVELVVAKYPDARARLDALVAKAGGYVDSTNVERRQDSVSGAAIVVRVPEDRFVALIPALEELGEVVSETTNAADITDQYVDLEARLASARTLEKRLLELATAHDGNIDQVLSVERELARVRGEIEGYEGHLRQWSDQIAMSTLTIQISTKQAEIVAAPVASPSLGHRTSSALGTSVSALEALGAWLVVNGIALLPWLVLLAPLALILRRLSRRIFPAGIPRASLRPTMVASCGAQQFSSSPDAGGSGSAT